MPMGSPWPARNRRSWSSSTPTRSRASSTASWRSMRAWTTSSGTAASGPSRSATWSTAPSSREGPTTWHRTALFIGGSDVAAGEAVLKEVQKTFFAGFRVSVLLDSNGANTTAAAAVLAALEGSGGSLDGVAAAVLAATGPVGQRVARLLGRLGATVSRRLARPRPRRERPPRPCSRPRADRSPRSPRRMRASWPGPWRTSRWSWPRAPRGSSCSRSRSAAGSPRLKVAIDLNAVPPWGSKGSPRPTATPIATASAPGGRSGWAATKMKIHKRAVQELFTANDKVLDAEEVLAIGRTLG